MLMGGAVLGAFCLLAGLLLAVVVLKGGASASTSVLMWWLLGAGLVLLIGCRWLFGRFVRGYLDRR